MNIIPFVLVCGDRVACVLCGRRPRVSYSRVDYISGGGRNSLRWPGNIILSLREAFGQCTLHHHQLLCGSGTFKIAVFIRILFGYEACFLGPMLSRVGTSWTKPLFTSPCSPSTQLSTFSVDDDFRVVAAVAVHSVFAYRLRVLTLSNAPTLLRSCCSQAGWQT